MPQYQAPEVLVSVKVEEVTTKALDNLKKKLEASEERVKKLKEEVSKLREGVKRTTDVTRDYTTQLRWIGRDLMRISMFAYGTKSAIEGFTSAMEEASPALGAAMEDIRWGFQEIAYQIGEATAPMIETFADRVWHAAHEVTEWSDTVKTGIGFVLFFGRSILMVIGPVFQFLGFLMILRFGFYQLGRETLAGANIFRIFYESLKAAAFGTGELTRQTRMTTASFKEQIATLAGLSAALTKQSKATTLSAMQQRAALSKLGDSLKGVTKETRRAARETKRFGVGTVGKFAIPNLMGLYLIASAVREEMGTFAKVVYGAGGALGFISPILAFFGKGMGALLGKVGLVITGILLFAQMLGLGKEETGGVSKELLEFVKDLGYVDEATGEMIVDGYEFAEMLAALAQRTRDTYKETGEAFEVFRIKAEDEFGLTEEQAREVWRAMNWEAKEGFESLYDTIVSRLKEIGGEVALEAEAIAHSLVAIGIDTKPEIELFFGWLRYKSISTLEDIRASILVWADVWGISAEKVREATGLTMTEMLRGFAYTTETLEASRIKAEEWKVDMVNYLGMVKEGFIAFRDVLEEGVEIPEITIPGFIIPDSVYEYRDILRETLDLLNEIDGREIEAQIGVTTIVTTKAEEIVYPPREVPAPELLPPLTLRFYELPLHEQQDLLERIYRAMPGVEEAYWRGAIGLEELLLRARDIGISFQYGGIIPETGTYLLHEGEVVLPEGEVPVNITNTFNISATIRDERDIEDLARMISEYQRESVRRAGIFA